MQWKVTLLHRQQGDGGRERLKEGEGKTSEKKLEKVSLHQAAISIETFGRKGGGERP